MANTAKFNTRVIQKHDIEANWLKATGFIPLEGEVIIYDAEVAGDELPAGRTERITHARMKIGDGVTLVSNLEFVNKYADVATLAGYAGMAEQDGEGHNIVATYATKSEISGFESQITAIDNTIGAMDVSAPSSTTGKATTFVDSITQTDGKISYTTKTVNFPTDNDTKVTQSSAITTNGEYPVLLAYSTSTGSVTNTVNKTSTLKYNPSTKILTATTFKGALNGNATSATKATNDGSGNNIVNTYVPKTRTVNGKALSSNITLSATDVGAYTKAEIDRYEFITVDDIDTICGAMIQVASANDRSVTF